MVVVLLSARNTIKGWSMVSVGLADSSLVHPREVFRAAVVGCAVAVVVMHNHPSGDSNPSAEDIRITRQLVDAGRILDIKLMDHVVIGQERTLPDGAKVKGHTSLREAGLVDFA
jgi:DNA repair protein RadC